MRPDEYAAIHFHDDDIVDCRWPATHEWTVPSDLKSGSYALMLEAGEVQENIPFFVVPRLGRPQAKIAVLMSTFTYVIYQNNARFEWLTDPPGGQLGRLAPRRGTAIRTTPAIIRSTGGRRTTTTRIVRASASHPGTARC